jgi:hypothetical protein
LNIFHGSWRVYDLLRATREEWLRPRLYESVAGAL